MSVDPVITQFLHSYENTEYYYIYGSNYGS